MIKVLLEELKKQFQQNKNEHAAPILEQHIYLVKIFALCQNINTTGFEVQSEA